MRDRPNILVVLCLALGPLQPVERAGAHLLRGRTAEVGAMLWYNVTALPEQPRFDYTARQTHSGLTIYVSEGASFHTPIPNTRYFNPYLELRDPADIRWGFRNGAGAAGGLGYSLDDVIHPAQPHSK